MEKETYKLDKNRRRVKMCPCGKSNRDGKFAPFKNHDKFGYCHSCCESFFPDGDKMVIERPYTTPKAISKIPHEYVSRAGRKYSNNNFIQWLKIRFGDNKVQQMINEYLIGTSKHWDGATIFWQIDKFEIVRTGQIVLMDIESGKRVKEPYNHIHWVHSLLKIPHYNLKQCLVGSHLLDEYPNKTVAITEGYKTMGYMSIIDESKLWLSTGSKANFKYDLLKDCYGRKIIAYPDKSEYHDWLEVAFDLNRKGFNITVDDTMENSDLPDGSDLVDYYEHGNIIFGDSEFILDDVRTEFEQIVDKIRVNNPAIDHLIKTFDCTDEHGFEIRTKQ